MTKANGLPIIRAQLVREDGREMLARPPLQTKPRTVRDPYDLDGIATVSCRPVRIGADATIALREAALAVAEAAARARSVAELLDEALAELQRGDAAPGMAPVRSRRFPRESGRLSVREREVLALVAEGQTNKAIASALYVSPSTVKTHVTSLLNKLQADSRAELAAIATRLELNQRAALSRAELAS